ncbi:hypothetical protein JCM19233_129 [Vibrio astriarenae]|nr:hypothetical protein JCM19233_129 [Vibrio sp. C7]
MHILGVNAIADKYKEKAYLEYLLFHFYLPVWVILFSIN